MKAIILIISILSFSIQIFGQSIYSGIWTSNDYYFDFHPDINLLQPENNNVNIIEIDLNGDGTNDIRLSTYFRDGSNWYWEEKIEIQGLNQNQIAYSQIDSCLSNDDPPIFVYNTFSPFELNYNQLIDSNLKWTDSPVILSFTEFNAAYPTNMGFTCFRVSQFKSDTGYIAMRLIESLDTLYGWIKISNVNYASCIIHEFACNNNQSNIQSSDSFTSIFIYPNPSNGQFMLKYTTLTDRIKSINVYNSIGQLKKSLPASDNNIQIDISNLPDGVYFVYLETSHGTIESRKIVLKKN